MDQMAVEKMTVERNSAINDSGEEFNDSGEGAELE